MSQLPCFINTWFPTHVCKLNKAIYGLKQPHRAWYTKLSHALLGWGSDPHRVSSFASRFNATFVHRDLGRLHYFLSLDIMQAENLVHLNQHKYVYDLLQRTSMLESKSVSTLVGAFQYLTLTRPYISFVVNKACQFMSSPSNTHWLAVKHILLYLKGTASYGFSMQPFSVLDIQAYTDVDWASCLNDRRNTSGYCIFIGPNLVSWSSTKQKIVSRSSAEFEYRGLALCLFPTTPPLLWYDNQSATHLAANPCFTHEQSILNLIFILFVIKFFKTNSVFNMFHLPTKLLISSPNISQALSFLAFEPNSLLFPNPRAWGDDRSQLHQQ
ncbi:hypothetical protein AAG906_012302 [Vitis piasezkii]